MKYVMLEAKVGGVVRKFPVIFPNLLVHREVAAVMMQAIRRQFGVDEVKPVSAGEAILSLTDLRCHGGSETLGLKADAGDAEVILMNDYFHGV